MKIVCICDGGNVRSQALAYVLKDMGHDAVPVGRMYNSAELLELLCEWAELVVIMQPHMEESIPKKFKPKLRCVDVGVDRYGIWIHPELLPQVKAGAKWLTEAKK